MIRYRHLNRLQLLFRVRGTVIPLVWPPMVASMILSLFCWLWYYFTGFHLEKNGHMVLTFPIAFMLVFRTNASYGRFWEGRSLYDEMVRAGTELIRQTVTYIGREDEDDDDKAATKLQRDEILRMTLVFFAAVRGDCRLRSGGDDFGSMVNLITPDEAMQLAELDTGRPLMIANWISQRLCATRENIVFPQGLRLMEENVMLLVKCWRSIQKISFTPLPFPYAHILYWLMFLWSASVPFALVADLGPFTIMAAPLLVFSMYGLDAVGSEIEDPFGYDANDLDLQAFENAVINDADAILPGKISIKVGSVEVDADLLLSGTRKRTNTTVLL